MYESRIAADPLTVALVEGFPPAIDALAACNLSGRGFLRAAWYRAGAAKGGRTLLLRRGDADDEGAAIAALPTVPFGPMIAQARKIPGSYWPFRAPLIAPGCNAFDLAEALEHPAARGLGPVWRVGPARACDPAIRMLIDAAQLAGWAVLARAAGTSWVVDLDAARAEGHPRASLTRKLRARWRKLETLGTPYWRHVRGNQWDDATLDDLARIEADSWIARTTDGSGAKFMTPQARAVWQGVLADPALARMLAATILMLDDRPVAFSFDLDDGAVRYGIAGSYSEDLARFSVGKIVNYRAMDDAIADGRTMLDLGAGDSGYKREMGAAEGYALTDLLLVRHRAAARLLAPVWGRDIGRNKGSGLAQGIKPHG